ncbi:hypothetical protein EC545_00835 [Helicobacter pylori]|uniref:hypothetical protein n=1 Tax=Helicobacter pylori TaxID=210 RepID=UPI000FDD01F2|nr:hypothetical protein [Helicobacter pylori]RVZ38936.1 hypothetical protein EC545_00835 [Helicobacter pylori]RVZ77474.1 hypothetical protein EC593_02960 [Helicobacter pylori]
MGNFFSLGKSPNDTQENPKDAQKSTSFQEKYTKPTETTELVEENKALTTEKERLAAEKENLTKEKTELQKQVNELKNSKQVLENEKADWLREKENLTKDRENLTKEKTELTEKNKALTTEKENLTNQLNESQKQASQTSQKLNELEQKHAPYQKLEKLYEVFLEVKDRLNFNFVATTHSAMDLIASVLSDSKYYLESLYNQASQELGDKRSDKGEKLAELFDSLFEYVKDNKFERLKEPSAYDYSCKTLYPEQNSSQKMQRVVLRGYKDNDKVYHTIVDMGS